LLGSLYFISDIALRFLEYETVLGPEEFDASTHDAMSPGLAAPPATLLGSTSPKVNPHIKQGTLSASNSDPSTLSPFPKPLFAGTGARTTSGRSNRDRAGQEDVGSPQLGSDTGRLTVFGPGLGDLLTEARLNRIEHLLLELLTREVEGREVTNGATQPKEIH
jgi:hypothetical protein